MIHILVAFSITLAACQHPRPDALREEPVPLGPTDRYILRNLFVGSLDSFSPIGARGNPLRTPDDLWMVIPVVSPPHPANPDEENAYMERTVCLYGVLDRLLHPESPDFDPRFESLYKSSSDAVVASLSPTAAMGALRDRVLEVFEGSGLLARLLAEAEDECAPVQVVPDAIRAGDDYLETTAGIRGRRSFSGPPDPCAIFRYCATPDGPALVYDLGSQQKQRCFAIHEELLETGGYRELYAEEIQPFLEQVLEVPPERAPLFLQEFYAHIPHSGFYQELLTAYEASVADDSSRTLLRE